MNVFSIIFLIVASIYLSSCGYIKTSGIKAYPVQSPQFRTQMERIAQSKVRMGNSIRVLHNGDQFFGPMLGDIRGARESIEMEMFIVREGRITQAFMKELCAAADRGVKVRLIFDAVGSRYLGDVAEQDIASHGIELRRYRPLWKSGLGGNNRDHRKYLIVDERIAYTGGAGINDIWLGNGRAEFQWRDDMYRISGPVLLDMRKSFFEHWESLGGDSVKIAQRVKSSGDLKVQEVLGGVGEHSNKIGESYYAAIIAAKKEIVLSMAYTCPPKKMRQTLSEAIQRGVKVRAIIPSAKTDTEITRRCGHHFWKHMKALGADVYEYSPTMFHVKSVVVDRYLSIVGASNFDNRSFFINEENNLLIYDKDFAERQIRVFEKDLRLSRKMEEKDFLGFHLGAYLSQSQL